MLKKLLKYDLKSIFKGLLIFYSLSLFFAVLTRILFSVENSVVINIIAQICSGVTISMMFNIVINNLIRLWVKARENFYGDESYLTHTLPVNKNNLYLSKTLTSIISLFTSVLVIGLTLFVAYYSKENIELLKNVLEPLANLYNSKVVSIIFVFLFIMFLEFLNALQAGFTGIILGNKMETRKTLFVFLYGFATYMITQIIGIALIFLVSLFDKDLMNLFITTSQVDFGVIKVIIYLAIAVYSLLCILIYLFNSKIFNKGVNVE